MAKSRIIALLAYDGFQLLDVTGPAAVFAAANRALGRRAYEVAVLPPGGEETASDSGVVVATRALARMPADRIDTLLIAGAEEAALRRALGRDRRRGPLAHEGAPARILDRRGSRVPRPGARVRCTDRPAEAGLD